MKHREVKVAAIPHTNDDGASRDWYYIVPSDTKDLDMFVYFHAEDGPEEPPFDIIAECENLDCAIEIMRLWNEHHGQRP
jgi:hypothetical protein